MRGHVFPIIGEWGPLVHERILLCPRRDARTVFATQPLIV